jgi:hypothetical protein
MDLKEEEIFARKTREDYEYIIQGLLAKKAKLTRSISKLNPLNKTNQQKILSIEFHIKRIDDKLKEVLEESGIELEALPEGSKVRMYLRYLKTKCIEIFSMVVNTLRRAWKNTKKFCQRNEHALLGILGVIVSGIVSALVAL